MHAIAWAVRTFILGGLLLTANATHANPFTGYDPFEESDPFDDEATTAAPIDNYEISVAAYQQPVDRTPPPSLEESLPAPPSAAPAAPEGDRPDPDAPEARIPIKPMCELTTNIVLPSGLLPRDYAYERPLFVPECFDPCSRTRFWPVTAYNWVPSCLTHNPLYFEEPNLERYGYGCSCYGPCASTCVQSVASGAHFFARVPMLPYMMATDCPTDCIYTLGNYRPGNCPPWQYTCPTRPSWEGVAATAGVATGIIFLVP
jgi:hypothetical protein